MNSLNLCHEDILPTTHCEAEQSPRMKNTYCETREDE